MSSIQIRMVMTKRGWTTRRRNGNDKPWNKGKKGVQIAWNKGIKLDDYPAMGFQKEHKDFRTEEGIKIGAKKTSGKNHHNWKGGVTPLLIKIRNCYEYRQWRSDVFTRDNFTCQRCGAIGGSLNAHHKKSFSKLIEEHNIKTFIQSLECEELWNINNGITLCFDCHNYIHSKNFQYTA